MLVHVRRKLLEKEELFYVVCVSDCASAQLKVPLQRASAAGCIRAILWDTYEYDCMSQKSDFE